MFVAVASDPVMSWLISILAADAPAALKAIRASSGLPRDSGHGRWPAGRGGSGGGLITADIDATVVTAQSDKQQAPCVV